MIGWVPTHTGDCVEKESAVASLGQSTLLLPAWIKAALQANDRLKLYLSVLQSAAQRAANPAATSPDWTREIAHLGLRDATWLKDVATTAYLQDQTLIVPELSLWLEALASDLSIMARPLCDIAEHKDEALAARRDLWLMKIEELNDEEGLNPQMLNDLTHGNRHGSDSFHVLVIEVEKQAIHLTYSDLHAARFGFFQQMLEGIGFEWTVFDPRTTEGLNQGKPYQVGNAIFSAADDEALQQALEAVASRIVFVIDWNRARKIG